jgi:aminoglycoside 3-N-acetyltransferase
MNLVLQSESIRDLYDGLGVGAAGVVYITSDFGRMLTRSSDCRSTIMEAHCRAIFEAIGPRGTVVVPAATLNLCNTSTVFDPQSTASSGVGAFSEFIRCKPGALRSFHPFWSHAALGKNARELVENVSRHAFGAGSVWSRLVEADALSLHIGVHPRKSFSVVHHIELVAGVPYRYTKEFMHPVLRGDVVAVEPFYHFARYRDADLERDGNFKIYDHFVRHAVVREAEFGRGRVWAFSMRKFYELTLSYLSSDLYGWLRREPAVRPYQL